MTINKLSSRQKWFEIVKHKFDEFTLYILIFLTLLLFGATTDYFQITDKFALAVELIIFLGLLAIKIHQIEKEWIESIPDFLTVEYKYEDQVQIKVEMVPLVSLSGVREQVQTLAKALNGEENVELYPVLHDIQHGQLKKVGYEGYSHAKEPIELHRASIELKKPLPKLVKKNRNTGEELPSMLSLYDVKTDKGEYLYWRYPFKESEIQIFDSNDKFLRKPQKKESEA